MLNELNLPTLQSRRQKQRLIFFYKVAEGQVPAMPPDLKTSNQSKKIWQLYNKQYSDFLGKKQQ